MKQYNHNKMGKNPLIVFLCCVFSMLLLAACSKDNSQLRGKWRWVETSNSVTGTQVTPESDGMEVELLFTDNTVTAYKDGKKIASGPYAIEQQINPVCETDSLPFLTTNFYFSECLASATAGHVCLNGFVAVASKSGRNPCITINVSLDSPLECQCSFETVTKR